MLTKRVLIRTKKLNKLVHIPKMLTKVDTIFSITVGVTIHNYQYKQCINNKSLNLDHNIIFFQVDIQQWLAMLFYTLQSPFNQLMIVMKM